MEEGNFSNVIYPELSYKVTGMLFTVHNELGRFCNEQQYGDAVEGQLKRLGVNYESEKTLPPAFEEEVKGRNRVDFLIDNKVILELKTKRILTREDYYQVKRYLDALHKKLGLLVNFRDKYLRPKRILNSAVTDEGRTE